MVKKQKPLGQNGGRVVKRLGKKHYLSSRNYLGEIVEQKLASSNLGPEMDF